MYLQCRKKTANQASLWLDHVYLGLSYQDAEDPLLDLTYGEDTPLDLTSEEQKASCGKHLVGPTLGSATCEDYISEMTQI